MVPIESFRLSRPHDVAAGALILKNPERNWLPRFVVDVPEADWHPYSPGKYFIDLPSLTLSRMPTTLSEKVLSFDKIRLEVDPQSLTSPVMSRVGKGFAFHYRGEYGLIASNGAEPILISSRGALVQFRNDEWPQVSAFEKWSLLVDGPEMGKPYFEYESEMLRKTSEG